MTKRKVKRENKIEKIAKIEITGVLLILVAIIGWCNYGLLGRLFINSASFLVGIFWLVLLIILGLIGAYMVIKRERPNLLTTKLIGLYIIVLGILSLFHLSFIESLGDIVINYTNVIKATYNNLTSFVDGSAIEGGGMIGALISVSLIKLVSIDGARVVSFILIVCGFIMFTGFTVYDLVKIVKTGVKEGVKKTSETATSLKHKEKEIVEEEDNKVVISSMDELKEYETPHEEVVKDEIETIELNEIRGYTYPPITILKKNTQNNTKDNQATMKETTTVLQEVFKDFGIEAKVVAINIGPAVTQYEVEIKAGTKLSRIVSLDKELALALAAKSIHIQAPIPGKKTVGVEIPNLKVTPVTVREVLEVIPKSLQESRLLVTLGKDIMGKPIFCEINKTPHLLVAGATGSGKSVCINSMLVSLLMRNRPDEVKLVLVDPKKVELSVYNGAPHLLTPVVTDPKKANIVLKKIVTEMEQRYDLFEQSGTKDIAGYNAYIDKKNSSNNSNTLIKHLPYIVVVIDELADLMLVAAKEVEESIMRITQMARAAGIHLIVATQRPSTDVITGIVKANIPCRISFAVSSSIDSRTILDMMGAEKLLGKGDMLFLPQGENTPTRVQGTFISDDEIKAVVDYTIKQQKAHYDQSFDFGDEIIGAINGCEGDAMEEPLYNDIVEFVVTQGKASASLLQRRFRLGYNRAARAMDLLEDRGIIGPSNGSKPRDVLVKLDSHED